MWRVKGAEDRLADRYVEHSGTLAIDEFSGTAASTFDAHINIECGCLERHLGTAELNYSSTRQQAEAFSFH
jgi:hypothetical protein